MKDDNKFIYVYEEYVYSNKEINNLVKDDNFLRELLSLRICANVKGGVKFTYVGIIVNKENIYIVLPKYVDKYIENKYIIDSKKNEERNIKIISQVLKVIKKCSKAKFNTEEATFFTSDNIYDTNISEIALADYIINDYLTNGLYEKYYDDLILNGDGDIDWRTTVELIDPFFSNNMPIYFETYNQNNYVDLDNFITKLHEHIVKVCIYKYGAILGYTHLKSYIHHLDLDKFNGQATILSKLEKELNETFIDRNILLLKALYNYIYKRKTKESSFISLYGTTHFNLVWEEVCSKVLNNQYSEYSKLIDHAEWIYNDRQPCKKGTLEPDIIRVLCNNLILLDAKYYDIKYSNYNIVNNPGTYDICKQFLYEKALNSKLSINKNYNILLYPIQDNEIKDNQLYEYFGTVNMKFLEMDPIRNLYLNADKLYDLYLCDKSLSDKELIHMFIRY